MTVTARRSVSLGLRLREDYREKTGRWQWRFAYKNAMFYEFAKEMFGPISAASVWKTV